MNEEIQRATETTGDITLAVWRLPLLTGSANSAKKPALSLRRDPGQQPEATYCKAPWAFSWTVVYSSGHCRGHRRAGCHSPTPLHLSEPLPSLATGCPATRPPLPNASSCRQDQAPASFLCFKVCGWNQADDRTLSPQAMHRWTPDTLPVLRSHDERHGEQRPAHLRSYLQASLPSLARCPCLAGPASSLP